MVVAVVVLDQQASKALQTLVVEAVQVLHMQLLEI
jgi:hypothetical protein